MALTLVARAEVVVRVGVLRDERDGALVGGDGVVEALHLVEHIARSRRRGRSRVGLRWRGDSLFARVNSRRCSGWFRG